MRVARIKKTHLYDVFTGNGWKNHSRYYLEKSGRLSYVSGVRLSESTKTTVSIMIELQPD